MNKFRAFVVSPAGLLLLAAAAVSILILVGTREWLGPVDWSGLGQWVGGVGAFVATGAALYIASGESRRERVREVQRFRINAHYISASWVYDTTIDWRGTESKDMILEVRNVGAEPVLNVNIIAVHVHGRTTEYPVDLAVDKGPCHVLLPKEPWRPDWRTEPRSLETHLVARFMGPAGSVEITFEDLGGTRWRRIGIRPPVIDGGVSTVISEP
jgi:hypothetical protein